MHAMPPFPPPVPAQMPSQKTAQTSVVGSGSSDHSAVSMPPPSLPAPSHTISSPAVPNFQERDRKDVRFRDDGEFGNGTGGAPVSKGASSNHYDEGVSMVEGGLEPSGISFGSISMASVDTKKLEPAGTSFGSMMSFTVASGKAPDMVDGGLEPIGTSFGSLSLSSVDRSNLARALQPEPIGEHPKTSVKSYQTPTLLSQQRSTGNLLECSDTESEDEEEDHSPNQASQSADWEKLKEMLNKHTNMENKQNTRTPPAPSQPSQPSFEALPHTGFDRDFSNISALSMGEFEDFDHLSQVDEGRHDGGQRDDVYKNAEDAAPVPLPPSMKSRESDGSASQREQLELWRAINL